MKQQSNSENAQDSAPTRVRLPLRRLIFAAAGGFLLISLATVISPARLVAQKPAVSSQPKRIATLVGAVSRVDSGNPHSNMDAVVLVENGRLRQPYPEYNERAQRKFGREYFSLGKKYRVTFGGGEVGTATIQGFAMGCNNIHATATVEDNGKIPAHLSGLATNSDSLAHKPSSRRAPTEAERQAVMMLVTQIYRSRGTTPALLRTLKTTNLTATDLNGDGELELIGSFVIETKNKARRDLLLIAEPQAATPAPQAGSPSEPAFKTTLVKFQAYKLPPEGFDSAIDFVDQLDLDNDGVAEVFVTQHGFDAYGYAIYKKSAGRWRQVYTTTGDAC